MRSKNLLSLLLFALAWVMGTSASAQSVLSLDAEEYTVGDPIVVSVAGADQFGEKDWVGIYEASMTPSSDSPSYAWMYVDGQSTLTFAGTEGLAKTVQTPGDYYVVLLKNDGYEEACDRVPFTVVAAPSKWDEPALVDGVYQIATASELEWFSEYVAQNDKDENGVAKVLANAVLVADLDFTGITHKPIGTGTENKYQGKFDGQGHRIMNMVLDLNQDGVGVFGYVRGNCSIKNLIIDASCSFKGKNQVGSFIGAMQQNDGFMDVFNCINYADVEATVEYAGGIAGGALSGWTGPRFRMHSCVNFGNVKAPKGAAAFVGYNKAGGGNAQIWHCYNAGTVTPVDGGNSAFRGSNRSVAAFYDLVNTASNMQGEHIAWATENPAASGELCWYLNNYKATDFPSEGVTFKQTIGVDPYPLPVMEGPEVWEVASYRCDGASLPGVSYSNTDPGEKFIPEHTHGDGYRCTVCGTVFEDFITPDADGFYHLSTVDDVEWFSAMVRELYHGCMNVKLDNDIDFGGVPNAHYPIGTSGHKWAGIFDGQGHRIKGMVLTPALATENADYDGRGFFGSVRAGQRDNAWDVTTTSAVIKNLIIDKSCSIESGNTYVAGIVGHINARQDATGSVSIINCGNEANITGRKMTSSMMGGCESTEIALLIEGCWNTGDITGSEDGIGGVIGSNQGSKAKVTMTKCWNAGNIKGSKECAALSPWLGSNGGHTVADCWNVGTVQGVDGTNTLFRGSGITSSNLFDAQAGVQGGKATKVEAAWASTGELCYRMNGDQTNIVWHQTLGVDEYPNINSEDVVYATGVICGGNVADMTFSNTGSNSFVEEDHIAGTNGFCSRCGENLVTELTQDEEGYYLLSNAAEVMFFQKLQLSGEAYYGISAKLTADIDFEGLTFTAIGGATDAIKFRGTFDGQGHRIKNLTKFTHNQNVAFIGWVRQNATIKNLIIDKSCSFTGQNHVAGVLASAQIGGGTITIENCINEADVHVNDNHAGGIFGKAHTGNMAIRLINCGNAGTISGDKNVVALGSWMGNGDGSEVINCWNTGLIIKSEWERGFKEGWQAEGCTVSELNLMNGGDINKVKVENTYDASASEIRTQGTLLVPGAASDGELTYKLNGDQSEIVWYQTIGLDEHPVLDATHKKVIEVEGGYANELLPELPMDYTINEDCTLATFTVTPTAEGSTIVYFLDGDMEGAVQVENGTFTVAAAPGQVGLGNVAHIVVYVQEYDADGVLIAENAVEIDLLAEAAPEIIINVAYNEEDNSVAVVYLQGTQEGTDLYYTLDANDEEPEWQLYEGPVTVAYMEARAENGICIYNFGVREYFFDEETEDMILVSEGFEQIHLNQPQPEWVPEFDQEKVYTIANNVKTDGYWQDNGQGTNINCYGKNENSYWRLVSTGKENCYYIQNVSTKRYVQAHTNATEVELAMGDMETAAEYYIVKCEAEGAYGIACTEASVYDFTAGCVGLNLKKDPNEEGCCVQTFAAVAGANHRSFWKIEEVKDFETAIETPTAEQDGVRKVMRNGQLIIVRGNVQYNAAGQRIK